MSSATAFRIVAIVSIFAAGLGGAALPFAVSARWPRLLGLLNAAAAGVFLAAALVHLLDDAEQNGGLQRWSEVEGGRYAFPWAPAFCLLGFLLLTLVGEVARALAEGTADPGLLGASPQRQPEGDVQSQGEGDGDFARRRPRRGSNHGEPLSPSSVEFGGDRYVETGEGALTAVVVFAALSVHSVLAGLPLGAEGEGTSAYGLFIAIMAHKSLAAFALGSNFVTAGTRFSRCTVRLYLLSFSCMTPAGIAAGWLASSLASSGDGSGSAAGADSDDSATVGVLSALASGTFLYVSTMELLPDALARGERGGARWRVLSNGAIVVGALAFATLARWT